VLDFLEISDKEIIRQVKLSCRIPSLIEAIAARKVVTKTADELGVHLSGEELQKAADHFRLVNNLQGANETWLWLKQHGLSVDEFEEMVYADILTSKLAQRLFGDKVEPFFFAHQIDYTGAVLCEVILGDKDLATELFYAIQEGEINFHNVAYQHIQDAELRRAGGYRGLVLRKNLRPEISAAVFSASPPQILNPISTPKGVHLILVQEIIQPLLDDVRRSRILSDFFAEWLRKQVEELEIALDISDTGSQTTNAPP
jgi:parvulin-like peptidyl-prolyl isomerase